MHHDCMAGRRQHYLPQFLQRRFRFRSSKGQDYVYSHEAMRSYSPSTTGLGLERDFYGHPDQSSADENITQVEGRLGEIVKHLNEAPGTVSQEDYAVLVAALSVRTKKMREAINDLIKKMARTMGPAIDQHGMLRAEIDSYWADQRKIDSLIEEEIKKQPGLNRALRSMARVVVKRQWMEKKREIYDQMHQGGLVLANQFFERMEAESEKIAGQALKRVFEEDPGVPKRVESLKEYTFFVIDVADGDFILGDCATVGVRSDGQVRLAFGELDQANPLAYIFLPISPTRCVVASRSGDVPTYPTNDINRFSAALSHRFFISKSEQVDHLDELRKLIGTADPMASDADVETLMRSLSQK